MNWKTLKTHAAEWSKNTIMLEIYPALHLASVFSTIEQDEWKRIRRNGLAWWKASVSAIGQIAIAKMRIAGITVKNAMRMSIKST